MAHVSVFVAVLFVATFSFAGQSGQSAKQHPIVWGQYKPPPVTEPEIQSIWGKNAKVSIRPLGGGYSGGLLYLAEVSGKTYVVRRTGGIFGKAGIAQEITLMKLAAEKQLAPQVIYSDIGRGLVVMEKVTNVLPAHFAPGLIQSWPEFKNMAAEMLRNIHTLKPDRKLVTNRYIENYVAGFREQYEEAAKGLKPEDQKIIRKLLKTAWKSGGEVLCHNDFHGRNILYDGKRLFAIDWEIAGWGPRFYDLAYFSNSQAMTNQQGREFLDLYLKRPATSDEYAEFVGMRKLQTFFSAAAIFGGKKSNSLDWLGTESPVTSVRNLYLALDQGLVKMNDPAHLFQAGLFNLRYGNYFR